MKNRFAGGHEVAPECCVVCGKPKPERDVAREWHYLAGSVPMGAITCSPACTRTAVRRHEKTGRVDTPDMRVSS